MALTQRLEFRQSQSLVMTPQLMQAIKLLQLSNLDLSAFVEEKLESCVHRFPLGLCRWGRKGRSEDPQSPLEDLSAGKRPIARAASSWRELSACAWRRSERVLAHEACPRHPSTPDTAHKKAAKLAASPLRLPTAHSIVVFGAVVLIPFAVVLVPFALILVETW